MVCILCNYLIEKNIEFEKFKLINNSHKKAHIRSIWYYSVFFPIVEILSAISIGLLIWWGGIEAATTNRCYTWRIDSFYIIHSHVV